MAPQTRETEGLAALICDRAVVFPRPQLEAQSFEVERLAAQGAEVPRVAEERSLYLPSQLAAEPSLDLSQQRAATEPADSWSWWAKVEEPRARRTKEAAQAEESILCSMRAQAARAEAPNLYRL